MVLSYALGYKEEVFALVLEDPGLVLDLLMPVAFATFCGSIGFAVAWVVLHLVQLINPAVGLSLNGRVNKYLLWSIGTFLYSAGLIEVISFLIRMIRWYLILH